MLEFQPDAIYYVAHQDELFGPPRHLVGAMYNGYDLPFPCLEGVLRRAGIGEDTSWGTKQYLLAQNAEAIVLCTYQDLISDCRRRSILPVWIYLPVPGIADAPPHSQYMVQVATRGGFVTLDLSDWADDSPAEVKLNPLDHHANALGHRIIAGRIFEAIQERPELLPSFGRPEKPSRVRPDLQLERRVLEVLHDLRIGPPLRSNLIDGGLRNLGARHVYLRQERRSAMGAMLASVMAVLLRFSL